MISVDDHDGDRQAGKVLKSSEFKEPNGTIGPGGKSGMPIGLKSDALRPLYYRFRLWLARKSLFEQFAIASSVVLTLSVAAVGGWVSARVSDGVLRATSGAAALYMTNFVEPHVQSMGKSGSLSPEDIERLDAVTELIKSRRHAVSIKIWRPDGVIVYSDHKGLIGKQFATGAIIPSLKGEIRAGMADFDDYDSDFERSLSMPLYEIFLPLYKVQSEKIIAVAEIYEDAGALLRDQASAAGGAWLIVGSAGLCTLLVLFAIVYRGSHIIERQRAAIKQRFREQQRLHRKNDYLKSRVQEALRTSSQIDDLIQTRIGAELHDGPAQLMSFVLLRLDEVEGELKGASSRTQALVQELRNAAGDALKEFRAISAGLFLPASGEAGSVVNVVQSVICAHERRTNCIVALQATNVPDWLPREIVRCIGRVVQEALNNAFKHSGAERQRVSLSSDDRTLTLSISDSGRGMPLENSSRKRHGTGLGLLGMASRVESVGGSFTVRSKEGSGTEVICTIPIVRIHSDGLPADRC
jgi:signal transduction histidine kinase